MPANPAGPAAYEIEPELCAPPPRRVRLRAGLVKWERLLWSCLALLIAGPIACEILPDYLIARFGAVVPAEVTYTLDRDEFARPTPGHVLLAHLNYEWRGTHQLDRQRVSSDLQKRFRSHTVVSVKVLRPWRARLWLGAASEADWRKQHSIRRAGVWVLALAFGGVGWIGAEIRRRQRQLVREGAPVVGRVVRYENWLRQLLRGSLPERGFAWVHYEYPASRLQSPRAGDFPPVSGRTAVLLPARLPAAAGGFVTILIHRQGVRLRYGLYAANLYEAIIPPAPTLTPAPKTG